MNSSQQNQIHQMCLHLLYPQAVCYLPRIGTNGKQYGKGEDMERHLPPSNPTKSLEEIRVEETAAVASPVLSNTVGENKVMHLEAYTFNKTLLYLKVPLGSNLVLLHQTNTSINLWKRQIGSSRLVCSPWICLILCLCLLHCLLQQIPLFNNLLSKGVLPESQLHSYSTNSGEKEGGNSVYCINPMHSFINFINCLIFNAFPNNPYHRLGLFHCCGTPFIELSTMNPRLLSL